MIYPADARLQGRGKVERLFDTLNTELSGHFVNGKPAIPPRLSLSELDRAVGAFIAGTYHAHCHSATGQVPLDAWWGRGFLPRLPDSLEDLDLLLIMHTKPRVVRRDGIHFQGLRYISPTLAGYVSEAVTLRYDPCDLSEVRVFHRDRFLCRAVSEEHAGESVTLKDIEAAQHAHRRALRAGVNERVARVADYLPARVDPPRNERTERAARPARTKLRIYEEDGP